MTIKITSQNYYHYLNEANQLIGLDPEEGSELAKKLLEIVDAIVEYENNQTWIGKD